MVLEFANVCLQFDYRSSRPCAPLVHPIRSTSGQSTSCLLVQNTGELQDSAVPGAAASQAVQVASEAHEPEQRPEALRRLMQGTAGGEGLTVVTTAQELADAASSGAQHIELRSHLDLTEVNVGQDPILGYLPATVKSIRVRLPCMRPHVVPRVQMQVLCACCSPPGAAFML